MALTEWQKNSIRQLQAKRNQLAPAQRARLDELSKELDAEGSSKSAQASLTSTPPVTSTARPVTTSPPKSTPPATGGYVDRAKSDISIGWRAGVSDVEQTAANAAKLIPTDTTRKLGAAMEETAKRNAPTAEDVGAKTSIFDNILQGVGGVVPGVVKYGAALAAGALLPEESALAAVAVPVGAAVIGGIGALHRGKKEAIKEGLETGAAFALQGQAGKITSLPKRLLAGAAAQAVPAYVASGGDIKKAIAAGVMGTALSVRSPEESLRIIAAKAIQGGKEAIEATKADIAATLNPEAMKTKINTESVSPEFPYGRKHLTEDDRVKDAKQIIVEEQARRRQAGIAASWGLRVIRKTVGKLTPDQQWGKGGWAEAFETKRGKNGPVVPFADSEQESAAWALDEAMTKKAAAAEEATRITGDDGATAIRQIRFYDDFLPHIFKDPKKTAAYMKTRHLPVEDWEGRSGPQATQGRPLGGGTQRFKHRAVKPVIDPVTGERMYDESTGKPIRGELIFRTIAEAREDGLELVHDNVVDAFLDAMSQLDRFIMKENIIRRMSPDIGYGRDAEEATGGILRFRGKDDPYVAAGYKHIDDPAFVAYGLTQDGKRAFIGYLDAPEAVAKTIENQLSPGLTRYSSYRFFASIGNAQNFATLGISAYHAIMTAMQALSSDLSLGIEKIVEGGRRATTDKLFGFESKGGAGKTIASGLKDIAPTGATFRDPFKSFDVRRELREPGSTGNVHTQQIADWFVRGGMSDGLDPVYKTQFTERLQQAVRDGKTIAAIARVPGAVLQTLAKPIMEHYVPLQKIAAFAKMAEFEMERLGPEATEAQKTATLQAIGRSVENRFGQLTYDNVFWDKTAKDIGMLTFRALGYKLGTWREFGGAAKDWATFMRDIPSSKRAEFTRRMAYSIAHPMAVGIAGAITTYVLEHLFDPRVKTNPSLAYPTGHDYLYPRTGLKDEYGHDLRVQYPSYMRDFHSIFGGGIAGIPAGVARYLENSSHPLLQQTWEFARNAGFNNVEIRDTNLPYVWNGDDPLMTQLAQVLGYERDQWTPISLKNEERLSADNAPPIISYGSQVGITKAPADVMRSDAENYATELMLKMPGGNQIRKPDEAQRRSIVRNIRTAIRTKTDPTPFINQGVQEGLISPADIRKVRKSGVVSSLMMDLKNLDQADVLRVYLKASPEERASIWPLVARKRITWNREIAHGGKNAREIKEFNDLWRKVEAARSEHGGQ